MIPLANPAREHEALRETIESNVLRVLRGGHYILGPEVEAFEQEFAQYLQSPFAIGVSNGSDAIVAALQALGIGPGDEVLTTPFSYFATASAIVRAGATPTFADITIDSFNLDPAQVRAKVTAKTKAVLAVHLFGRPADVPAIEAALEGTNIPIIEDVAQGCGATLHGKKTGTLGTVATFSFFPAKPLGCAGDGGACTTNDPSLAERLRQVRITGATAKNVHEYPGGNYRLDPVQAAVLRAKLPAFEERIARRRQHAQHLREALADVSSSVLLPQEMPNARHVYAQFSLLHPQRDRVLAQLRERGVGAEIYYPIPMPYQKVFASLGHRVGAFPVCERACREVFSIPVHSELTEEELTRVATITREVLRSI